jgi:hypothetical protein
MENNNTELTAEMLLAEIKQFLDTKVPPGIVKNALVLGLRIRDKVLAEQDIQNLINGFSPKENKED